MGGNCLQIPSQSLISGIQQVGGEHFQRGSREAGAGDASTAGSERSERLRSTASVRPPHGCPFESHPAPHSDRTSRLPSLVSRRRFAPATDSSEGPKVPLAAGGRAAGDATASFRYKWTISFPP
ncbi:hypothetical protein GCM10009060_06100 [Halorubrum trapanicum]